MLATTSRAFLPPHMPDSYTYVMIHPEPFLDEPGTFCDQIEGDAELHQIACANYVRAVEQQAAQAAERVVVCYDEDDQYAITDGALPVLAGLNPDLQWQAVAVAAHEIAQDGLRALAPLLMRGSRVVLAGAHRDDCVQRFAALLQQAGYEVLLHERALLPRREWEMAQDLLSPDPQALPTPVISGPSDPQPEISF